VILRARFGCLVLYLLLLLFRKQCTLRKLAGRARLQGVSWLAPECFRGEGLSKHSDVYAFGSLMWELYTGEVRERYQGAA
jgi:hypothetical protein